MTDDEERRARRSEALAAARDAGGDDNPPGGEGTDRGSEDQEQRRQPEERRERSREQRQGGRGRRDNERQQGSSGRHRQGEQERQRTRGRRDGGERHPGTEATAERVSAGDHDATLVTAFEHDGYDCELGRIDDDFFGFVRVPPDHDRLHLLWELDVPGEFGYGPDADGWVGFDTRQVDRELSPREAAMAVAGLAAQVAERSRSVPE